MFIFFLCQQAILMDSEHSTVWMYIILLESLIDGI